ncbi:prolipoprotein diacylglyceryl transferase [Falsibacillus albus]|uniref:Diacylglyceryl transferase n=1 Tax=Falsibacillus albus TaxID=2478915 RepID=A0A3L7JU98_9BACI|nr:prolipoprotein diacylglyceryl transferase family protein [Falsibacillus albus]RLQ94477.1 diacylglyceryl transferase [Falsibacillus albus]
MDFPVWIHLGGFRFHPHLVFETLSYFIGFRVYLWTRNKERIPYDTMLAVLVGAIVGAALGSKLLYWLEDPIKTIHSLTDLPYLMEGKTIVGGLLGGLIGVEAAKKMVGWKKSTGDEFVLPLIVGMSIGRVGCFLTGLDDHTYGTETKLPFGVDFGDGVPRHPTQLYEIVFLFLLAAFVIGLRKLNKSKPWEGFEFQLFMAGYLLFRLLIDFIKPTPHVYFGLNNIQLAAIAGLIYYGQLMYKKARKHDAESKLSVL